MRLGALLTGLVAASAVSANNGNGKGNAKPGKPGKNGKGKPNIVLILTDDQDLSTLSPDVLPHLYGQIAAEGTHFTQFFAPVSLCCPSRVSLLRAQHAHNHNVTYVSEPYGGWPIFNKLGYTHQTILNFMQEAGYGTYYTGKLMNGHNIDNCASLPVSGVTEGEFLVDPWTYDYWSPGFCDVNTGQIAVHNGSYSSDVVAQKVLGHLDTALSKDEPFFVVAAPIGPHSHIPGAKNSNDYIPGMSIPQYRPQDAGKFADHSIERHEGFNPDFPTGVSWVKDLPRLNQTQIDHLDDWHRARLRALQPIDALIGDVFAKLDAAGVTDETYVIYTSDNGYALGSHRRQPGKTLGFEEDTRVPLFVRGPGVEKGRVDTTGSWGIVDLGRTILDLGGAKTSYENDGQAIDLFGKGGKKHDNGKHLGQTNGHGNGNIGNAPGNSGNAPGHNKPDANDNPRHALSEYWILAIEEGPWAHPPRPNNTYRTLRVSDGEHKYSYSVWCTGERELHDLNEDPHQVRNLLKAHNDLGRFAAFNASAPAAVSAASLDLASRGLEGSLDEDTKRVAERLDALLLVLKTCQGQQCREPWASLFPTGEVTSFADALDAGYDGYFQNLPRVKFDECALGYQARRERPLWEDAWAWKAQENMVVQS
ncbi:arylsulfatase precursor [Trichosporon asahii var. asahii CBS 8904]|uniref:Arylsulfatase n=1 Tax=Trichosporon asahii var. asahii (strain CBS 8904) TaxID=1220162 RepID=K1WPN8_TRIAC|nr:arylsulfatase precursor [Trichosporon asahii var. asahii CBS 8904]